MPQTDVNWGGGGQDGGERRNKVIVEMQKKMGGGGGGGGDPVRDSGCMCKRRIEGGCRSGGGGGQGGCIEVIVKFEEKSREEVRSGSLVGVQSGGGMGGCEQRIEVIVCENAKKKSGW